MTNRQPRKRGSISLAVIFILFIFSAALAGYVWWRLSMRMPQPEASVEPSPLPDTVLQPQFTVAAEFTAAVDELTEQLLQPMRAHYATREEYLSAVTVQASPDIEHSSVIRFTTVSGGSTVTDEFFYDRTGDDRTGPWPRWNLSMLDATVPNPK